MRRRYGRAHRSGVLGILLGAVSRFVLWFAIFLGLAAWLRRRPEGQAPNLPGSQTLRPLPRELARARQLLRMRLGVGTLQADRMVRQAVAAHPELQTADEIVRVVSEEGAPQRPA